MKSLQWDADCCSDLGSWTSFGRIFLTDNLSEIQIWLPSDSAGDDSMTSLLHAIPECSPNISRLTIETQDEDVYTYGPRLRLSHFLSQLSDLSEFTLPSGLTRPDTLRALSRLPSLRILTLGFSSEQGLDFDAAFDPEDSFPSLTSISIHRGRSSDIEHLLNCVSNKRNLEVLLAEFTDYTTPVLEAFVRGTCGVFPALRKLTITRNIGDRPTVAYFSADGTEGLPSLSRTTSYHLRHYRHLGSLSIAYYRPSEVTDDGFMELVEALPNLTQLEFVFLSSETGIPCLTLRVLHRLSKLIVSSPNFVVYRA